MSMYLYNTAPLPWYPAEWNKSVLPFAVVYRMVGSDAVPTHRMLCCSESPYVTEVDGVQVIAIPPGSNHNFTHFSGNDFWHDIGSNDELANAETFGYLNPSEYEFVWCYISIYDVAGNLVYPGSTPTLIEEEEPEPEPEAFDLQSFKTGLAIYLSIRPCVFPHREPVAFLYNGVRLPGLPEWDKEKYPYAVLTVAREADGIIRYQSTLLQLFGPNAYYFWNNEQLFFGGSSGGEAVAYKVHNCADGVWSEGSEYETNHSAMIYPTENVFESGAGRWLTWTNFDAEYEGRVYLAASDPVPVYE